MNVHRLFNSIGRCYPFFLTNLDRDPNKASSSTNSKESLTDNYYLYGINSPGLDNTDLVPYISMEQISEKINSPLYPKGTEANLLRALMPGKGKTVVEYFTEVLATENAVVANPIARGGFPRVKIQEENNVSKNMIVNLRAALKSRNYRFFPGRLIDILWTRSEYMVFRICWVAPDVICIRPVGLYRNTDPEMNEPLPVNFNKLEYPRNKFNLVKKETGGIYCPDLEAIIKKRENISFETPTLVK